MNTHKVVSKGREVPGQTGTGLPVVLLSRDKKNFLSRCPFVPGQGQEQMSRDKITPQKPGKRRSKTEKGRSKTGKWRSETGKGRSKTGKEVLKQEKEVLKQEKEVLKQKKDVLKQERMF